MISKKATDYMISMERRHNQRERIILPERVFPEEMALVNEVLQCEGIISTANSQKPILATYELAECNALVWYSDKLRREFMAHVSDLHELTDEKGPSFYDLRWTGKPNVSLKFDKSLELLKYWLTLESQGKIDYDIHIVTGYESDTSATEKYVSDMNRTHGGSLRFNLVNIDRGGNSGNEIAIDLRTGKRVHYEPYNNPHAIDYPESERNINERSLVWKIDDTLKRLEK